VTVVKPPAPARPYVLPGVLALAAVAAVSLALLDVGSPVRALVVAGFVLLAPGLAILDVVDLASGWFGIALACALSIALGTLVATVQLFTGTWSPDLALVVLALVTVAANVASAVRHHVLRTRVQP
jgi:hypothetical protein